MLEQVELARGLLDVPFASYSASMVSLHAWICSTAVVLVVVMFGFEVMPEWLLVVVAVCAARLSASILLLPSLDGSREEVFVPKSPSLKPSNTSSIAGGSKSSSIQPIGVTSSSTVVTF